MEQAPNINTESGVTSDERPDPFQTSAALTRLGHQLALVFLAAQRRLRQRIALMVLSISLLTGIGAYIYVSLAADKALRLIDGLEIVSFAIIVSVLTAIGIYPSLRKRNRWLLVTAFLISRANINLLAVLSKLTELRGGDTEGHNLRGAVYMMLFAKALKLPPAAIVRAVKGALLHDVGKLVVPDRVLDKHGPLTPEERAEMEKHVLLGGQIVAESKLLSEATSIVATHHEHYDGSGYPKGLKGEDIPYESRMFALIDVFDALISTRVYKSAYPVKEALDTMAKGRGSHFDPVLFDRFVALAPEFAHQMPQEEAALITMLTDGMSPYLDRFFLGQAIDEL